MFSATARAQAGSAEPPVFFFSGGRAQPLYPSTRYVGVQVEQGTSTAQVQQQVQQAQDVVDPARSTVRYGSKNILAVPIRPQSSMVPPTAAQRREARTRLKALKGVRRAVRVFGNGPRPIVETDEFLIRFAKGVTQAHAAKIVASYGAVLVAPLGRYAPNGYVARVTDPARSSIDVANALYGKADVIFSHPNLIWPKQKRFIPNDPFFSEQWHLRNIGQGGGTTGADVKTEGAWNITRGSSSVVIAINDDGVDLDHEDFQDGKLVAGYDFAQNDADPRPVSDDPNNGDHHGTACAGVAAGVGNNGIGISGAAPGCRLMPIRLIGDGATLQDEADSFRWAADHGASIISNSWGPPDQDLPSVPHQAYALPDATRDAIRYATTSGRGGKGCVVVWAAGNGSETCDDDGYSANPDVITVAASTNSDRRAGYSDYGASVDVTAPSNGGTLSIMTTDRTGAKGYDISNYNNTFGGTSSAAPLVAGVAALVLSANPGLTAAQVRQVLQDTADKIDTANGAYDGSGHSNFYGYGRVNALRAVESVVTASPTYVISGRVTLSNGTGVAGVEVRSSSTGAVATTSSTGDYSLSNTPAGSTTLTPSKTAYTFTPASRTLSVSANTNGLDFIAQPPPLVTLVAPADNSSISGAYVLNATTLNDAVVQRMDWALRPRSVRFTRNTNLAISDYNTITDAATISGTGVVGEASVTVDIRHTFIGDLQVVLIAPDGTRTILYNRSGADGVNLQTTFNNVAVLGKSIAGTWKLEVNDNGAGDTGTLVSWGMALGTAWTNIGAATAPSGGRWTANWSSAGTTTGIYEVRAQATSSQGIFNDVNTGISISGTTATPTPPPATTPRFTISGRVATSAGAGIANVRIARSDTTATVLTNANGEYLLTDIPAGTYSITPAQSGAAFTPSARSVSITTANVTGINFAPVSTYTISGHISSSSGAALVNVSVTRSGSSLATTTNSSGNYAFRGVPAGTYVIAPNLSGSYFSPSSRSVSVTTADMPSIDFMVAGTDRTPPALTVVRPTEGALYSRLTSAAGKASDAAAGVAAVTGLLYRYASTTAAAGFWAGGSTWTSTYTAANEVAAQGTTSWVLAMPALSSGRYYLRMTAQDRANNIIRSPKITFVIDSSGPVMTVTRPAPAPNNYYASFPTASGTAVDTYGGVSRVTVLLYRYAGSLPAGYWVGGSSWSSTYSASNERLATGTTSWSITLPALVEGHYFLRATGTDSIGNRASSAAAHFYIDRTAPSVTVRTPTAGIYLSLPSASGTAADSGGAVRQVAVRLYRYANSRSPAGFWAGGSTWTAAYTAANDIVARGTTSWSLSLPTEAMGMTPGHYALRATASDVVGNRTNSASIAFDIAGSNPRSVTPASATQISTASVSASTGLISLAFDGALDAATAADPAHYAVSVNGVAVEVESASYAPGEHRIVLGLPSGALRAGDVVRVAWNGLRDARNRSLAEGAANIRAR